MSGTLGFARHSSIRLLAASRGWQLGVACLSAVAAIATASIGYFCGFNLSTAGSIEILLVVLVALRWGFLQATVLSITSLLCLNYLFTAPLFKFSVSDPKNLISLGTFEATALLVSRLSSQARLHAAEAELERGRNVKLYELSRAILLIDVRQSASHQVEDLIRELINVESVEIWGDYDLDGAAAIPPAMVLEGSAYQTYFTGVDSDDPESRSSRRILRSGTHPIGALALRGWECDPPLADAIASLVAIALERSRSIRKENRAEAERNTEQLRTAVLDGLAHGYKTPLTAIQAASSGLLAISQLTPTQTELVSIIDDQATVLGTLTTRLLKTAALEGKQIRVRRKDISISALINDLVEVQDDSIRSRIEFIHPSDLRPVSVDAELLGLALTQLIDNAAKYSAIGPLIIISVTQDHNETIVVIANEGPPIPMDERERIFHRFYRGIDAARGPTGTGLGLSIVKKAAESHGGRAWVESRNGTNRFSLSIPNY